jgi:hypothetical protein
MAKALNLCYKQIPRVTLGLDKLSQQQAGPSNIPPYPEAKNISASRAI